jgi:hypothetical protein
MGNSGYLVSRQRYKQIITSKPCRGGRRGEVGEAGGGHEQERKEDERKLKKGDRR